MLKDLHIIKKEIEQAIYDLDLNLEGLTILTEAGTGLFALTPIIAALANAKKVYALSKDTQYGTFEQVKITVDKIMEQYSIPKEKISVLKREDFKDYAKINIITNLGHVRPLDEKFLSKIPKNAVISYMREVWEYRNDDLDIDLCKKYNIKIAATDEEHPMVNCFRETGLIPLQLAIESKISIFDANILIISRDKFGKHIKQAFLPFTKNILIYSDFSQNITQFLSENLNLIITADFLYPDTIIGNKGLIAPNVIKKYSPYVKIIQCCGKNTLQDILSEKISIYPEIQLEPIRMIRTLADISYKALIRLHAGGLKVGEFLYKNSKIHNIPPEVPIKFFDYE